MSTSGGAVATGISTPTPREEWGFRVAELTLALCTVAAVPLVFDIYTLNVFELPKAVVFRLLVEAWALIAVVGWGVRLTGKRHGERTELFRVSWCWLDASVALLILALAAATAASVLPWVSWSGSHERQLGLLAWLHLGLFYVLMRRLLRQPKAAAVVTKVMVAVAVAVATYGVLQYFGFDLPGFREGIRAVLPGFPRRAFATLGHPNFLGALLVIVLPLALYYLATAHGAARLYYGAATAAVGAALVAAMSRGAWLAALVELVVFGWLASRVRQVRPLLPSVAIVAAVGALAVGILMAFAPSPYRSALVRRVESVRELSAGSGEVRLWLWQCALALVYQRPLLGYGPETFYLLTQNNASPFSAETHPFDRAHNSLLDIGVAGGVVAAGAYVALLVSMLYLFIRQARRAATAPESWFAACLAAAVAGYAAVGMFSFDTTVSLMYFFIAAALAASHARHTSRVFTVPKGAWLLTSAALCAALVSVLLVAAAVSSVAAWQADRAASAGEIELRSGNLATAEQLFTKAVRLREHEPTYAFYLARLARIQGERGRGVPALRASLAWYNQARALGLAARDYYADVLQLFAYWSTIDRGKLVPLLDAYTAAEPAFRYQAEFWGSWGVALAEVGRDQDARAVFQRYRDLGGAATAPIAPYLDRLSVPY